MPCERGVDDRGVLQAAMQEGRVLVTEDVTTFAAAIAVVPDHVGVVYCHHAAASTSAAPGRRATAQPSVSQSGDVRVVLD